MPNMRTVEEARDLERLSTLATDHGFTVMFPVLADDDRQWIVQDGQGDLVFRASSANDVAVWLKRRAARDKPAVIDAE